MPHLGYVARPVAQIIEKVKDRAVVPDGIAARRNSDVQHVPFHPPDEPSPLAEPLLCQRHGRGCHIEDGQRSVTGVTPPSQTCSYL